MARQIVKQENILLLYDYEYPMAFYIIKSGHSNQYLIIDEDPFDHSIKISDPSETLTLCHMFDTSITMDDLPKAFEQLTTSIKPNSQPVKPPISE